MTPTQEKPKQAQPGQTGPRNYGQHRKANAGNRKFIAAGAVIALAALAIVVVAMQGSSVYYLTIAEFHGKQASLAGDKEVRLAGKVVPGSIARDERTKEVSFLAMDKVDATQTMKVVYNKIVPDTFKDEAEVVVTGTYTNGVFSANEMLAKCPSKYSSTAESN
ncbi:MAG: CcmE/CycJ protein [Chloroflexi bacterium]|jgi:cytochrome c-type biogenesis protein CcmE|nr:CcmE/CycJ protein [Chloroflexota bacterium]